MVLITVPSDETTTVIVPSGVWVVTSRGAVGSFDGATDGAGARTTGAGATGAGAPTAGAGTTTGDAAGPAMVSAGGRLAKRSLQSTAASKAPTRMAIANPTFFSTGAG